jgi:hypothetical protein
MYVFNPDISLESVFGLPFENSREARKLGLLPQGISSMPNGAIEVAERNESVSRETGYGGSSLLVWVLKKPCRFKGSSDLTRLLKTGLTMKTVDLLGLYGYKIGRG